MLVRWPERAAMIADALRAFELQTWPWRELVVVNDGAPVAASPGITVVNVPTKVSIGAAREIGRRAARGEWHATWDNDDFALPEHLATYLGIAQRRAAVYAYPMRAYAADAALHVTSLMSRGTACGCVYRADAAAAVGGYPDVRKLEDVELIIRLRLRGYRLVTGQVPTYVYRRHATNASLVMHGDTMERMNELAITDEVDDVAARLARLLREPVTLWIRGA